jgi:uncharacterized membrane protein
MHLTLADLLGYLNLLCAGVFAGEELTIRFGVRGSVAKLDPQPQIQLRQSLILTLRVLVPALFGLTLLSGAAVTVLGGSGLRMGLRCAGLAALAGFISVTLGGTVPINKAALTWDPSAPPPEWRALVARWERLDTVRTWAVVAAFASFLAASFAH